MSRFPILQIYPNFADPKGLCLIINNENFRQMPKRVVGFFFSSFLILFQFSGNTRRSGKHETAVPKTGILRANRG